MILKKFYQFLNLKKSQKLKIIYPKLFSSYITETEFYELYYELDQLKNDLSFKCKKILDIGCGTGKFLTFCNLFENPYLCVGLDPAKGCGSSENALQIFRDKVVKLDIKNIKIIEKDIWNFKLKDLKFDIITTNFSLHHIIPTSKNLLRNEFYKKKHQELFLNIANMLVDNGYFIIKEVFKYHLSRFWKFYGEIIGNRNINWKTKHNPKEYVRILKECGFCIISIKFKIPSIFNKFRFFFSNALASFFFNPTYFIIAKKY